MRQLFLRIAREAHAKDPQDLAMRDRLRAHESPPVRICDQLRLSVTRSPNGQEQPLDGGAQFRHERTMTEFAHRQHTWAAMAPLTGPGLGI